ncbi:hypothetical protein GCM10025776_15770 [Corallincola platygyrae]
MGDKADTSETCTVDAYGDFPKFSKKPSDEPEPQAVNTTADEMIRVLNLVNISLP